MTSFVRPLTAAVRSALDAHPQLLHVLTGPRQVGKTTIALDIERHWRGYVRDSLIEAVLARDVLSLERVTKPALLRHLFALACSYPAQALSFNKMLGQLQDAGNTTTLAHYLKLLESAYLVTGLEKFSVGQARTRGSSPKLVVWTNALVSAIATRGPAEARADGGWWGRLLENAVGAHLVTHLSPASHEVTWWRDGNDEVDYVIRAGARVWAIEVKSGRTAASGLTKFRKRQPRAKTFIIGPGGLAFDDFFSMSPEALFE